MSTAVAATLPPFSLQTFELAQSFSIREIEQIRGFMSTVRTPAEFWERCPRADWMIGFLSAHVPRDILNADPYAGKLREFACWCAREAYANPSARPFETLLVAERAAKGEADHVDLERIRHHASGGVRGAGAVGLPIGEPVAAIQLACFHAAHPDAIDGARLSSSFAAKAEQFRVAREHRDHPPKGLATPRGVHPLRWVVSYLMENPGLADGVAAGVFARQAEVLRFLLPNSDRDEFQFLPPCLPRSLSQGGKN
jgi:hypothetical protein